MIVGREDTCSNNASDHSSEKIYHDMTLLPASLASTKSTHINFKENDSSLITAYSSEPIQHLANADTGTTGHFFKCNNTNGLINYKQATEEEKVKVQLPNGHFIVSSHVAELNIPALPAHARRVHIFPDLQGSLLSIGDICDAGCTAIYTADVVKIKDQWGAQILTGFRDALTRLWMIDVAKHSPAPPSMPRAPAAINAVSQQPLDTVGDRVEFLSRTFGSPAESTLLEALDKGYFTFPGVTARTARRYRHRLRTPESAAGHLDQVRQNNKARALPTPPADTDSDPTVVITHVYHEHNHMDATGSFPITSHRGHNYIMVMFSEGANYIKAIPFINRTQDSMLAAYREGLQFFTAKGFVPNIQHLDNEISQKFRDYCKDEDISLALMPPHQHRRNKAERAIRTFKNHFGATLAGVDPDFPMGAWDELLEQVEITLNLLRPSALRPQQSAWEALHGRFDFNATPMAPPGTHVTVHEKPEQRASWAHHGVKGYYIGPAMDHYRCYRVWVAATQRPRISDTLAWHPVGYAWNTLSDAELVAEAASTLASALHHLADSPHLQAHHRQPVLDSRITIMDQLERIQDLFTATHQQSHSPPRPVTLVPPRPPRAAVDKQHAEEHRAPQRVAAPPPHASDDAATQRVPAPPPPAPRLQVPAVQEHAGSQRVPPPAPPAEVVVNYGPPPGFEPLPSPPGPPPAPSRRSQRRKHRWLNKQPGLSSCNQAMDSFMYINTAIDLDEAGQRLTFGSAVRGSEREHWIEGHNVEIVRLLESKTTAPIHRYELPQGRKPAYYNPQVKKKLKGGVMTYRVRGTIGGDQINDYQGEKEGGLPTPSIKLLLNAVVSAGAHFMTYS